jgi:hypothetical protein
MLVISDDMLHCFIPYSVLIDIKIMGYTKVDIWLKLAHIISAKAPQTGLAQEEKD